MRDISVFPRSIMLTKFVSAPLCYFRDNLKCDNFPLLILFFIFIFRFNSIFTSCYACRVTKILVARFDECMRISAKNLQQQLRSSKRSFAS